LFSDTRVGSSGSAFVSFYLASDCHSDYDLVPLFNRTVTCVSPLAGVILVSVCKRKRFCRFSLSEVGALETITDAGKVCTILALVSYQ